MTDFTNVRIPATRMGSGTARNSTRMRRHVTKGFYDEAPTSSAGSVIVNETTTWTTAGSGWFNVYGKELTGNVTEAIDAPNYVGQVLILDLVSGGTSYDWTVTGTFRYNGTNYTQAVFGDDGDMLSLVGLHYSTTLQWFVWANAAITVTLS